MQEQGVKWYNLSGDESLRKLEVNPAAGLSGDDVLRRGEKYGLNELVAKKKINPFFLFFEQFKSFIIYILLFALLLSVLVGEYIDALVILGILMMNAFLGFFQEYRAEKAIEHLKKLSGLHAQVIREGKTILVETREIVVGDIILLEEGNKVPADARLLESISLNVSEASLTGESLPVEKFSDAIKKESPLAERRNMVFSGTVITRGHARALVVGTGMGTEIGKIAGLITEVPDEQTPLQKKLNKLGRTVGMLTIFLCILVFIIGVTKEGLWMFIGRGDWLGFLEESKEWLLTAVSLAVAAVPEGLPAIVTIALSVSVVKMLKKNALIRKLPSVETLGETTVICTDKTGTLTKNEMTVRKVFTNEKEMDVGGEGYSLDGGISLGDKKMSEKDLMLFRIGVLCNNSSLNMQKNEISISGDPTEAALLVSAEKAGIKHAMLRQTWKKLKEEPFQSERKMMSTVHVDPNRGRAYVFTKGAPERVIDVCSQIDINGRVYRLTPKIRKEIMNKTEEFASQALRVLGFAYKIYNPRHKMEEDLIFVGLQGMMDPPHREVPGAIMKCHEAGIRVIMMTGDNMHTAEAIAQEVGITGRAMEGAAFAVLSKNEQLKILESTSVFARVEPAHKMLIVQLLQGRGHVVAMTGDGVNDAPAIKRADLGISMGLTGTDVAKEESDMVLQDDNFTSIVAAVEEGRAIDANIHKFIIALLSANLAEVFVIIAALVIGLPLPLTAVMLLWLNLLTDGLPALALSVDPAPKDVMKQKPRKASEAIITKTTGASIIVIALMVTLAVLAVSYFGIRGNENNAFEVSKMQTIAFTLMAMLELAIIQSVRGRYKLGLFSNKYLVFAIIASLALQLAVIYTPLSKFFGTVPLGIMDWVYLIIVSFVVFLLSQFYVILVRKKEESLEVKK